MAFGQDFDLRQLVLMNCTFGPQEIEHICRSVAAKPANFRVFRDAVNELETKEEEQSPAGMVRLGVCLYFLGRYRRSIDVLKRGDGGALAHFYMAKAHECLKDYAAAEKSFMCAKQAGYDAARCVLGVVEVKRLSGDLSGSLALLDTISGAAEQTAEYLYQRGVMALALGRGGDEVGNWFSRAVHVNGTHTGALFGLAMENDRRGNDLEALEYYKRAVAQFPTYVGALLNLGVMYEDRSEYNLARQCYERILDAYPDHPRARMYLKDAQASTESNEEYIIHSPISQLMKTPVADFELSCRSRNCLQAMGVQTLGDLCAYTEQELLASKNFGETSLTEIKEMLRQKNLQLGQTSQKQVPPPAVSAAQNIVDESLDQELLAKPISYLGLSVRARKCIGRHGIGTVGELIRHTGDELLGCKNFGVTSLNEVRERLAAFQLRLHGE